MQNFVKLFAQTNKYVYICIKIHINIIYMQIQIDIENMVRDEVTRQLQERESAIRENREPHTCVGQQALAARLHVSIVTINRWHREGKFDGCYTRLGKKIVYNIDKIEEMALS